MLLTDGSPNSVEDLRVYESAILNLAHTEMIDLEGKISLATEEVTHDVLDFLLNGTAVVDPKAATRRDLGVSDVVVTRQMKRWHALHTLAVVYRDGFHNQLNDRYKEKYFEYRDLARLAREQMLRWGVGLVNTPVPVAGAPVMGSAAGALPETTYWVRISWVSADGAEGMPGETLTFVTPAGSLLTVKSGAAAGVAASFNVYAGADPETLTLQNTAPVAIDGTFTLPGSGLVSGAAPGDGQAPDVYLMAGNVLRRG